jgi:hypothetical protein
VELEHYWNVVADAQEIALDPAPRARDTLLTRVRADDEIPGISNLHPEHDAIAMVGGPQRENLVEGRPRTRERSAGCLFGRELFDHASTITNNWQPSSFSDRNRSKASTSQ